MIVANGKRSMKVDQRRSDGATKRRREETCSFSLRRYVALSLRRLFLLPLLLLISAAPLRTIQTEHYILHTDVPADLAKDLALRLDAMFEEYSRRLVAFTPGKMDESFHVYVFRDRKQYARLTGDRFPNTGGIFISGQNLLAAFLEGQGRNTLRRTLQHEAFHQFAYTTISPNLPVWLNEGLAQVFEEGIFTGREFVLGQVPPRRLRQLQADLSGGRLIPFSRILTMDDAAWEANLRDRNKAASQYNQAWAMVHFLIYATDESGEPLYRDRLISMLTKLHNWHNPTQAFNDCFGDNYSGFEARFKDYAARVTATHAATYMEHQDVLADLVVALRKEGKEFSSIPEFRDQVEKGKYRIEYRKGQLTWSTEKDPSVYFNDLQGQTLLSSRLFFERRAGAPCPDIVCRPTDEAQLRTIFSYNDGQIEHETIIEPIVK